MPRIRQAILTTYLGQAPLETDWCETAPRRKSPSTLTTGASRPLKPATHAVTQHFAPRRLPQPRSSREPCRQWQVRVPRLVLPPCLTCHRWLRLLRLLGGDLHPAAASGLHFHATLPPSRRTGPEAQAWLTPTLRISFAQLAATEPTLANSWFLCRHYTLAAKLRLGPLCLHGHGFWRIRCVASDSIPQPRVPPSAIGSCQVC